MTSWKSLVEEEASLSSGVGRTRHTCPVCPHKALVIDYKRSLSIDHASGFFRCFRCGVRGRLRGYHDAFTEEAEDPTDEWVLEYVFREPSDFHALADNPHPLLKDARRYLARRRVTRDIAREAQIGYALKGEDRGRVIVPFLDEDGCWMGWQGRKIDYKAYHTEKDKKALMWNQPAVMAESDQPLMVCEGVYDALPFWPNAVACLGKPYGPQVELLMRSPRFVVFVLDGDSHRESQAMADHLESCQRRAGAVLLPPGQDPSKLDRVKVWAAVQEAAGSTVE